MNPDANPTEILDEIEAHYDKLLAEAEELARLDPPPSSPEGKRLSALMTAIERYEKSK